MVRFVAVVCVVITRLSWADGYEWAGLDGRCLIPCEHISSDTLEEEEDALNKHIPQHTGHQSASEIPEYLHTQTKTQTHVITIHTS